MSLQGFQRLKVVIMIEYRKLVPLINMILVALFAYYVFSWIERYRGTPEYGSLRRVVMIPIILLIIVVVISVLLYWFRVGERE